MSYLHVNPVITRNRLTPGAFLSVIAASAGIGVATGFIAVSSAIYGMLLLLGSSLIIVATLGGLLLGVVLRGILYKGQPMGDRYKTNILTCVGLVTMAVCAIAGSTVAVNWQRQRVVSFVERASPLLEHIRTQTGAYPASYPSGDLGEMPLYLRRTDYAYNSDGKSYRFNYQENTTVPTLHSYDSATREWRTVRD